MPILPTPSLRTFINKMLMGMSPAAFGQQSPPTAYLPKPHIPNVNTGFFKSKHISRCKHVAMYQQHKLHYVLKTLGYLPEPLLEQLVRYLNGPTTKQYEHANAHLRLILAVNNKLKRPIQFELLGRLRQRFAIDAVAMQSPRVWQQAAPNNVDTDKLGATLKAQLNTKLRAQLETPLSHLTALIIKPKTLTLGVNWDDKTITNADGGAMRVRCYQASTDPKQQQPNPDKSVMLFFHGGGFCIGDVNTHHEFCHAVCAQTGWAVVSVDYRLAPEHPAPTALRDCIAAYVWLSSHAHILGADPARIVLAGDSAGGCLATLVAQQVATPTKSAWLDIGIEGQETLDCLQNLPRPLAQMPLYPVTDIEIEYPSWTLYGKGLLLDHEDIVVFDAAYVQHSRLIRQHVLISPMLGDNREVCPTYIIAAELDILRDEAFAYAEQLQRYGIDVSTHLVLGAPHGFIHFMSVHQGLENEMHKIIKNFAQFVSEIIHAEARLAA
ncbi:alpha/beta hydrolase [Psychrobacter sp. 16-MNA-CIBAN-0192]|uniref:alpha/beta hydrolase n=1 Tax=Psychrobacter sp. 16-MNA-CIBAN-0192 TaxID=3140448 RepID=UPI00332C1A55